MLIFEPLKHAQKLRKNTERETVHLNELQFHVIPRAPADALLIIKMKVIVRTLLEFDVLKRSTEKS